MYCVEGMMCPTVSDVANLPTLRALKLTYITAAPTLPNAMIFSLRLWDSPQTYDKAAKIA